MLILSKHLVMELGVPNSYSFQYLSGFKWFVFDSVISFIFSFLRQVIKL